VEKTGGKGFADIWYRPLPGPSDEERAEVSEEARSLDELHATR